MACVRLLSPSVSLYTVQDLALRSSIADVVRRTMDTRNQAWAEDKNKFGYRMLQKMGWSEGKGLGKNEDGIKTHVRVKRKRTHGGIGAEATKESVWKLTGQVAASFSDVLARAGDSTDAADVSFTSAKPSENTETKLTGKRSAQSFFRRRSRQKNVGTYSQAALREILGGVVEHEEVADKGAKSKGESNGDALIRSEERNLKVKKEDEAIDRTASLGEPTVTANTNKSKQESVIANEAAVVSGVKKEEDVLDVTTSQGASKETEKGKGRVVAAGRVKKEKKSKQKKEKKNKSKKAKKKSCSAEILNSNSTASKVELRVV